MGEISFLYQIKNKARYEQPFRYQPEIITEYGFAYQRYVTLSDTSIINSPVAITKVAAGLSNLRNLFVKNREPMIPEVLDGFNVSKNPKKTLEHECEFVRQEGHSMIEDMYNLSWFTKDGQSNMKHVLERYGNGKHLTRYLYLNDEEHYIMPRKPHSPYVNILDIYFAEEHNTLSVYKTVFQGYMNGPIGNIIPQLYGKLPDIIGNIQDTLYTHRDDPIVNKLPVISTWMPNPTVNWIPNLNASRPILIGNFIKDQMTKNTNPFTLNVIKTMFGKGPDIVGNIIKILQSKRSGAYTNIYPTIIATPYDKNANLFDIYEVKTNFRNASVYSIFASQTDDKYAKINNQYSIVRHENKTSYFDLDSFAIIETKQGFLCNNYIVDSRTIMLNISYDNYFSKRDSSLSSYMTDDIFGLVKEKDTLVTMNVHGGVLSKSVNISSSNLKAKNVGKGIRIQKKDVGLLKNKLSSNDSISNDIFIHKISKDMEISDMSVFGLKSSKTVAYFETGTDIHKISKDMVISEFDVSIYKEGYDMSKAPIANDVFTYKVPHSIFVDNSGVSVYKEIEKMQEEKNPIRKQQTGFFPDTLIGVHRVAKDLRYYRTGIDILKLSLKSDYITDYEFVLKDWLPLGLVPDITGKYTGTIIPVSKSRVQSFIDDINEMASKYYHDLFITSDTFSSVIPKNAFIPQMNLFCDKGQHDLMINYCNHWIIKQGIKSSISKDTFISKGGHNAWISVNQVWVNKDPKQVYTQRNTSVTRSETKTFIDKDKLFAYKGYHITYNQYNDLFIDKDNKICYYYYDVMANKKETLTNILKTSLASKDMYIANKLFDVIGSMNNFSICNMYESMVFPSKMVSTQLNLFESLLGEKESYEMSIFLHDHGNWAWVYETPDPFVTNVFGIDELLLPENDTRYEDFEDIIFDKESLIPRDPVKMINETTFIAKFPIEHPIQKYADVGKIYGDSAEVWNNYLGIETDVMHEVFLKYYQIWQSKIFEFATMTMHQSTNKMLDLIYTWIVMYYPPEKMEQALRVFRQIRWYSESAIIRNSQYIVSYEYDSLRSNLHTGKCSIPNDLGPDNPTMYIESGVIRNNPDYIGQEVSVTFTIDIRKNTKFIFSLSNQVGTVKVYVNDDLVGLYPKSGIGYTINLPYTGQTNYVKIVKEANHNLDKNFYIGYIEIPGASFKDLSITFDPVLRAGNKPLDEVAKKLIAYANLHANRNEMYQVAKRNNAGIIDTYNKMNEYWKNHHQNKTKGKRLTIKQL